ncbi:MAG TPA: hypothetical protein VFO85_14630, partial [Vicinamibacteria bacterium]|nr:hypothetical protein [Vicinamibacteria bacterium]
MALAAAATAWPKRRLDAFVQGSGGKDVLYLWSGRHVKRMFPGFEHLAADIYWIRTVQYFGGKHAFT